MANNDGLRNNLCSFRDAFKAYTPPINNGQPKLPVVKFIC